MKKIAGLILSAMMLFAVAASLLANSVSLGYLVNGERKLKGTSDGKYYDIRCDAKNVVLGGNFKINDKFSFSGELTDCDLKGGDYGEFNTKDDCTYKLKGSYAILQNEQVRLDLSGGYLYREVSAQDFDWKQEYNTFFLGIDTTYSLAEKINITAGFEYGLSPDGEEKDFGVDHDLDADSMLNYQVNFNYDITKQIGLSLGYRSSCWEYNHEGFSIKETIAGITTSVTYKF